MNSDILNAVFMTLLIICAYVVMRMKDLLYAVILFGAYSLVMSLIWLELNAPDIAITEAAAGVGMSTIMVAVITRTRRREK